MSSSAVVGLRLEHLTFLLKLNEGTWIVSRVKSKASTRLSRTDVLGCFFNWCEIKFYEAHNGIRKQLKHLLMGANSAKDWMFSCAVFLATPASSYSWVVLLPENQQKLRKMHNPKLLFDQVCNVKAPKIDLENKTTWTKNIAVCFMSAKKVAEEEDLRYSKGLHICS